MPNLNNKLGIWTTSTQSAIGHVAEIKALGFDYIVARIVNHPHVPAAAAYQPDKLAHLVDEAKNLGVPVYAWAYIYPGQIAQQVATIAAALPSPCENLILDAEVEWENLAQSAAKAHEFAHTLAESIGHRAALHFSSFYRTSYHPLPYSAFLAHCESFMPQSYRFPPTSAQTVMAHTLSDDLLLGHQSLGGQLIATVNRPEMLLQVCMNRDDFTGANVWLWDGDSRDRGVQGHGGEWQAAIQKYKDTFIV